MALDDPVDRSQPQTGPFADSLGGKKRLEYVLYRFPVHTLTGIRNGQEDVIPWYRPQVVAAEFLVQGGIPGLQDQPPSVRHGVGSVAPQIQQDLLDLDRVGINRIPR